VPPKPDAPPHAAFATAKPGQARLSIGSSQVQRSSAPPPPPPQAVLLQQKLAQAKASQKGSAMKWVVGGAVAIVFGVGGYFGYGYFSEWRAKRSEAAKQSSTAATQEVAAAVAAEPAPAPKKELPLLPPIWTLDVEQATIPEGRANGMIAGTNFVVETARLDMVGNLCLLRLLQGSIASPDLGFMVYLRLGAGESVTGRTWTVSQEMRGTAVPRVVKLWKTDPRYAARQKTTSYGYAMKLELGDITNGVMSGRIFLALPPVTEQNVVAGIFQAETSLGEASGAAAANPAPPPGTVAPPPAEPANFEQRYGIKR